MSVAIKTKLARALGRSAVGTKCNLRRIGSSKLSRKPAVSTRGLAYVIASRVDIHVLHALLTKRV